MTEGEDPWQVLGVGREADERTLKKRYFALLREFPPETHPDDFARIQRAWEIVSDPAKRAEHTATQEPFFEVAEPWRSRLREALSLLKTDRVDLARVQLKTLVEENPDLLEARELLEQVYFNHEQWADAERELREMVARRPGQAHFLSRLILVLGRLERHADALAVAEAWREESHGRDAMAWVYVAETQSALKRHDDAFKTLAAGVAQAERKTVLVITRLQLRLETTEKPGPALKAMREDLELLARVADADEESRKAISQRLQSMAALFFNRNRATEGNELINASRRFWAETRAIQFPRRVDVDIDDLPPKSREWLVEESTNPHVFRVLRRGWVADVVVAVLASVPPALFAGMLLTTDSAWAFGSLALLSVALGASSWAMVWAWRRVALSFTVPHRRMVAVHPLYMLEVGLERMTAWPLVNFSDVRVVHHHTNGVYTQSVVTLTFAGKRRNVGIRGQELAVRFAETLQGLRYRALQLLHGGVLEADEAYDFIAADRLVSPPAPPTPLRLRRRRALVWRSAAVALASIAVVACSGWLGAVAQRERDLGAVLQNQNAQTIGSVLLAQSNPKAREVAERYGGGTRSLTVVRPRSRPPSRETPPAPRDCTPCSPCSGSGPWAC